MNKAFVGALGIAAVLAGFALVWLAEIHQRQQRFDLTARCSEQAERQAYRGASAATTEFRSRYDFNRSACLVAVRWRPSYGSVAQFEESIYDAFQGTSYGELWLSFPEGRPDFIHICRVALPSGRMQMCTSQAEFDKLTEAYVPWQ